MNAETVLVKRKVSKKFVPPDMVALKILMEREETTKDVSVLSDDELLNLERELEIKALELKGKKV